MAQKTNPALLGAFVVGAVFLGVAGVAVLGGGRFFRTTQQFVAYFNESIQGLAVGAPVMFRGVKVGSVTDIKVVIYPNTVEVKIPVFFEIDGSHLTTAAGQRSRFMKDRSVVERTFEQGLRAQLELQSFVTGQLFINLDFRPNTPVVRTRLPHREAEFPTIPSTISAIGKGLQEVDIPRMAREVQELVQGLSRLVNGDELKSLLASASDVGASLKGTVAKANDTLESVQAMVRKLDGQTVNHVNETLVDARQLVRRLDGEMVPAAQQVLADLRPLVADVQKTVGSARGALERAESMLVSFDGAMADDSPLGWQINTTLQEVSALARAFRKLTDYLERYPDSMIFGKKPGGGGQ